MSLNYWLLIRNISKKIKRFFIFCVAALVFATAGNLAKNIFLNQVKKKIQQNFGYTRLYLSLFPPALIIEDARSISPSPFFLAKKVSVKISTRSLLSRDKPFTVFIEDPVLRVYETSFQSGDAQEKLNLNFPFVIEKVLIRGGEFYYWGKDTRIQSQGIYALLTQDKDNYFLQTKIESNDLVLGPAFPRVTGEMSLSLEGQGNEVQIKNFRFAGVDGIVKAKGQLLDPADPEIRLETSYNIPSPLIAQLLELPFGWEGKVEGKGIFTRQQGDMIFSGSVASRTLVLSDVPMGEVSGRVNYRRSGGGSVNVNIRQRGRSQQNVRVRFNDDGITGTLAGIHLTPLANFLELPWPVASPAWGEFTVKNDRLHAEVEFRDELVVSEPQKYPFLGRVMLDWDGRDNVSFTSEALETSFANLGVKARIAIDKNLDINLKGDVKDVIQAREFTSLILSQEFEFPEIRGMGQADINIFGDFFLPQVKANISISSAGFDKLNSSFVEGEVELIKEDFFGRFDVDDPSFKGRIGLFTNPQETRANIWVDRGLVETILPAFDVFLPLQGEASGYFEYKEKGAVKEYNGNFSGERVLFSGQELINVKGKIKGDEQTVHFPEIQLGAYGGTVHGSALIRPLSQEFDVDLRGEGILLNSLYADLQGISSFEVKGKGALGRDLISGRYEIKDLLLPPFQPAIAQGDISLGFTDNTLNVLMGGNFFPGKNMFTITLDFPLDQDAVSGEVNGNFSNMDLLMPWKGVQADLNYRADIIGSRTSPNVKGLIEFQGSLLPFPRFAHAFRDFYGMVFVDNGNFSIRSFQGKFGGGDVKGSGHLELGEQGVKVIDIIAEGENLTLALLERTRALADGSMNLIKDENRFVLNGDFRVDRLSWRRELDEKFYFSSAALEQPRREPGFFDDLNLNIRVRAEDNAWMENSLGRIRGRFDLTFSGNVFSPVLLGDIEALGGSVDFQDREFNILSGQVSFFNPAVIEPYINFKAETYVKDYHVTFSLDGLPDRLNPEFSSSPPLPPEDVLALLALGEAFRRTYHYDRSAGQSTASLLSFTLSEEAKKRAEKLFSIDRFRIDPFILGSSAEMTARLTLGKKISRNFFLLYSTNLATQREEITRIEWELTRDLSIVGTRDETGRISFDVKVHKRF